MKFELYNSATISAPRALIGAGRGWSPVSLKVRWAFLDHGALGPTVVDTGYGPTTYPSALAAYSVENGGGVPARSLALRVYANLFRARLRPQGQIDTVLANKGLVAEDIQRVIVTHLHVDHISELRRFSRARILTSQRGLNATRHAGWRGPLTHGTFTELLPADLDDRLEAAESLPAIVLPDGLGVGWSLLPNLVSLVPLDGHAAGQIGIYLHSERYLYAVDAHLMLSALNGQTQGAKPGKSGSKVVLAGLPRRIADDIGAAEVTLERLSAFQQAGGRVGLCHDPGNDPFDVG